MMNYSLILFLAICCIDLAAQQTYIKGIVYEDQNGNNRLDNGERGIANVLVSDQIDVVKTNEKGEYEISSFSDFGHLFISMPSGYGGTYYYTKSEVVNFPIQKTDPQDDFTFIHASDTHIDSLNLPRMQRFREMADSLAVDFIIVSGDLIRDALRVNEATAAAYYKMYLAEIEKFKIPVFSGVGNHEIFGIERDKSLVSSDHPLYGKNMYRHFLGPNYYSFNYGGIHFLSIDGVDYQNLYYFGGVNSLQLIWLKNDLANVPDSTPIITFNHIPFISPGFSFQNFDNHIFYGPQLLMQNDKLAHRHIVYNYDKVKELIGNRPFPLALSGHYHAAQMGNFNGTATNYVQTSAITRPDRFVYNGFEVRSGFTLYEVRQGRIMGSKFIPLNLP